MDRSEERPPRWGPARSRPGRCPRRGGGGFGALPRPPGDLPALAYAPGPGAGGWRRTPPSLLALRRRADGRRDGGGVRGDGDDGGRARGFEAGAWWRRRDTWGGRAWRRRLRSFKAEGVWGTSPHLIPHFALHSPSGTISLALGAARSEPGRRRRPACRGGRLPRGPDLAVRRGRARRLAGPERLVARTDPGPAGVAMPTAAGTRPIRRGRMPRPGPGAAARRRGPGAAVGPGGRRRRGRATSRPRSTWSGWPRVCEGRGGPSTRTIATDPAGSAPGRAGREAGRDGDEVKRHGQ